MSMRCRPVLGNIMICLTCFWQAGQKKVWSPCWSILCGTNCYPVSCFILLNSASSKYLSIGFRWAHYCCCFLIFAIPLIYLEDCSIHNSCAFCHAVNLAYSFWFKGNYLRTLQALVCLLWCHHLSFIHCYLCAVLTFIYRLQEENVNYQLIIYNYVSKFT